MRDLIYKLVDEASWAAPVPRARFDGAAVDRRDGDIHFSTAAQVAETGMTITTRHSVVASNAVRHR